MSGVWCGALLYGDDIYQVVLIAESGGELQKLDMVRRNVACGSSGSMQGRVR